MENFVNFLPERLLKITKIFAGSFEIAQNMNFSFGWRTSCIQLYVLGFGVLVSFFSLFSVQESEARPRKSKKRIVKSHFKPTGILFENSGSEEFSNFMLQLKELKKGKKQKPEILIIGDSHMQCEDFGSALTNYFKDSLEIPVAGRGFVFPYPLARTSHRSSMDFRPNKAWSGCRFTRESNQSDWGLAGWTAQCEQDSVWFDWKMNDRNFLQGDTVILFSPEKSFQDFEVFLEDSSGNKYSMSYQEQSSGYVVVLPKETKELRFHIVNLQGKNPFLLQGLVLRPGSNGLVVGMSGTNGARLDHYLQSPDFQRHLSVLKPSLVIISLGTNDAFSRNFSPDHTEEVLQQLLTRIKSSLPGVAILLAGPPDHCFRKGKVNPKTALVGQVFSKVAQQLDFSFWDQQKAMGGKGSIFAWRGKGLATKDMVHFTPAGYALQARLLGRSFLMAMKNFKPPSVPLER